jgi:hypothetical protein
MAIGEIRENDIGTIFETTIKDNAGIAFDISSATDVKNFLFVRPDKSTFSKSGEFSNDGTDGLLKCTSTTGDWIPHGIFYYQ